MRMATARTTTDIKALKSKLKATWMAGDFGKIARTFSPGVEKFIAHLGLKPGMRVLDIGCGTGNQSLPAARTGAIVTGIDIAPNLIEQARVNAETAGLKIRFHEGDAEQLPYANFSFDVVITMFGAMFSPGPENVASELIRVCRPGGRIVMANWTSHGFIGQMFKLIAMHVPPPDIPSPILWGDKIVVCQRLSTATELRTDRRLISLRLSMSPADSVEFFRNYYGPTQLAFAALDKNGQSALRRDLTKLWSTHNLASDGTTHVKAEYLEVIAIR